MNDKELSVNQSYIENTDLTSLYNEGVKFMNDGRYDDSIPIFERLVNKYPDNVDYIYMLGKSFYDKRDFKEGNRGGYL